MDEGFDREFYRCRWRLVLPVGPDGIQPYVRATRGAGSSASRSALRRLLAISRRDAKAGQSFRPWGAIGAGVREGRRCR